jgi:membrane protein DedA with SNARE-associated domain
LLELFTHYFAQLGYLIIGLAALAEGLTIPCPSLAVLLMAGAATATNKMSFWVSVMIAAVSYTLGSIIPYLIGYNIPRMQTLPWAGKFVEASLRSLDQVNQLFVRHGEKIVAISRPFWIGNCVSYFAGLNRMAPWKFLVFTFLGILTWSTSVVYIGQVFSANLGKAASLIQQYSWVAFAGVVVLAALGWWLSRYIKFRQGVSAARD